MDPMRRKVLGRSMPKLGKNKQLPRSVIFMKRQRRVLAPIVVELLLIVSFFTGDKKWLETHIWHAKRMKMENMWGFRLVGLGLSWKNVHPDQATLGGYSD